MKKNSFLFIFIFTCLFAGQMQAQERTMFYANKFQETLKLTHELDTDTVRISYNKFMDTYELIGVMGSEGGVDIYYDSDNSGITQVFFMGEKLGISINDQAPEYLSPAFAGISREGEYIYAILEEVVFFVRSKDIDYIYTNPQISPRDLQPGLNKTYTAADYDIVGEQDGASYQLKINMYHSDGYLNANFTIVKNGTETVFKMMPLLTDF